MTSRLAFALERIDIIDNRAKAMPCYDPGYTFVEKLQTISTKFRHQQGDGSDPVGFVRHYYDVYELLQRPEVQKLIGTEEYKQHKQKRFRQGDNQNIAENEAFLLSDAKTKALYAKAHERSSALYYGSKPTFAALSATVIGPGTAIFSGRPVCDLATRRSSTDAASCRAILPVMRGTMRLAVRLR